MARLRYNGLATGSSGSLVGLTLGVSLTNSATSVTFNAALTHSNGTAVPTIAGSDYIPLEILDTNGRLSEIVYLTAYTAGATTGTISRGNEGTTGIAHSSGDKIVHGATVQDVAFSGAKVYRSAAYSLVDSALTDVPWDAEEYDTDGFHDNTTNNTRLTIPAGFAGKYALKANVGTSVGGNAYSRFILLLAKNGSVIRGARVESDFGASSFPMMTVSMDVDLAAGDYVTCSYLQISGGSRTFDTADCAMSIARLG